MTNNSDELPDAILCDDTHPVEDSAEKDSDNDSSVTEVTDLERKQDDYDHQLIAFFEKHTMESIAKKNRDSNPLYSNISNDVIEKAYQTVFEQKVLHYDVIKKRSAKYNSKNIDTNQEYIPTPSDILVSKDGNY